ncbi:PQQ-binding-like beta-propeller repeat protein [Aestuariicella hydrocarbonica]|uniref:PQQ-binding-like beta-propeller repeat protein n=1 Tax=Pseudomaricurvus hydrocarbonicus TaxID=1470433 RepID=A0A9E5JRD7_9GAMM|nr:PQQ-binding-like beta-propeller repeat protein [Aestuariicella hydrocarbonica]NHO64153.1 PQQ-binding-like beta-propeller repeat protein [Aestuariicella hydrocarbonica]
MRDKTMQTKINPINNKMIKKAATHRLTRLLLSVSLLGLMSGAQALDAVPEVNSVGQQLFEAKCAACHDNPDSKAPSREALQASSFESILMAMEFGRMQPQAAGLQKLEKAAIAKYLAGSSTVDEQWIAAAQCGRQGESQTIDLNNLLSTGWGMSANNSRYIPGGVSGIDKDNVGRLKLKWAFAYPQVTDARSQPVLTRDTLFVGSKSGNLFALDSASGCIKWRFKADSSIRSALVLGGGDSDGKTLGENNGDTLYFGDALSSAYAVDARTGQLQWKTSLSLFPTSTITGSPTYYNGKLFVPISSYEIAAAGMPNFPCCRSHGALVALNAEDGQQDWIWHGTEPATLQEKSADGHMRFGPSGVSVWSTPTVDAKRGLLYFGTAENLTHPATDTSDAIIALDLNSGEERWKYQALKNDVWNSACLNGGPNCPEEAGQDFDFGASVILAEDKNGNDILLAGQKSGAVYAFDPDGYHRGQGKLLWSNFDTRNTVYSPNPGIHWGMALEGQTLFVPIADTDRPFPGYTARPGLYALDINTGKRLWASQVTRGCELKGQQSSSFGLQAMRDQGSAGAEGEQEKPCSFHFSLSAAVTATDGLVFAGGLDGILRAYDSASGTVVWQTDTAKSFQTVNGVEGHGGAIDVDGPVLGNGMLFIHSGYSMFGQLPGNVLLGYEVAE